MSSMSNENVHANGKHEGEAAASTPAVVSDDTSRELEKKEEVVEDHESQTSSTQPDDEQEEPHNDLEASQTTASSVGPLYSVFSKRKKQFIVVMAALAGFFSPLSAVIFIPALNKVARDVQTSHALVNLTLTTYMIFQGLAPALMGNLADTAGRRPAYLIGFTIYIGACIGIALQDSFAALLILRCMQSAGSSSFVALGAGVAADISTSAERGTYMGWQTSGMLTGPAIGPIIGGVLAEYLGWRSIFWFLVIIAGVYMVPFVIAFPETGRNVVGNGSIPPQPWNVSLLSYWATKHAAKQPGQLQRTNSRQSAKSAREALAKKRKLKFPNPLSTLKCLLEPDIRLLLIYNSLVYTAFYDVTASLPYLFEQIYGYNALQIGLSFIPFGVGTFIAPIANGRVLDWNFRRVAAKEGIPIDKKRGNELQDFPLERARVPVALPLVLIGDAAMLAYGWALQAEAHVAVPLVLTFIMGLTLTGSFNVMSVMLVDNYPESPATATAANNLVRCLLGAGGTAVIIYMIDGMGRGWCFTFISLVVLAISPSLWVLMRWGPKWRKARHERLEAEKARDEQNDSNEKS